MSTIHQKTCPICGSTVDIAADFCPSCGSELNITATESSEHIGETTAHQHLETHYAVENNLNTFGYANAQQENIFPISWKIGNQVVPLKKKGYISFLSETEKIKTQLPTLKLKTIILQLGIFILNFIFVFMVFVVSSASVLILAGISKDVGLLIVILNVLLIVMPFVNYYRTRLAIYCLKETEKATENYLLDSNEILEKDESNQYIPIYNFILLSVMQYIVIALIGVSVFQTFSHILPQSEPIYTMKICIAITIIIVSLISPLFNVALKLSLVQRNGVFQNIFDASQFIKIGLKQHLGMVLITSLFPSIIFVLTVASSIKFIALITNIDLSLASPNLYIFQLFGALIGVTTIVSFSLLMDTASTLQYNWLLSKISMPPKFPVNVNVYNRENNDVGTHSQETNHTTFSSNQAPLRCNFCSLEIPPGLNFCPNCGHRVEE